MAFSQIPIGRPPTGTTHADLVGYAVILADSKDLNWMANTTEESLYDAHTTCSAFLTGYFMAWGEWPTEQDLTSFREQLKEI